MRLHALPGALPAGERVLWQGAPDWRGLARDAMHLRGIALYCVALVVSLAVSETVRGLPAAQVALDTAMAAGVAAVPLLVGLGYAWIAARCATYTITNRRVVIRMGVALTMTINLPFERIDGAGLFKRSGGLGEIRLRPARGEQVSAVILWPHATIWRGAPVLRGLSDAERAGQILSRALAASVDAPAPLASGPRVVKTASTSHGAEAVAA